MRILSGTKILTAPPPPNLTKAFLTYFQNSCAKGETAEKEEIGGGVGWGGGMKQNKTKNTQKIDIKLSNQ